MEPGGLYLSLGQLEFFIGVGGAVELFLQFLPELLRGLVGKALGIGFFF